ncbi:MULTISPECIES: outer membrane beta-barrel family protein [unclassified Arcicella]|uniref:outer membrane beta-barrel family protein n=1 Tax=unclassified Arcicella TaxID=2644986 RepID=UPI00285A2465|nr:MULTISPECIES: outer membrane beta-barrel family protein [unclassified Arcicella]MDR6561948.1 outer membrane receptor protein involved in Fe transport [Arcicella sp. BE51]MDR6811819.1 outer membrane receptor protein involved in Fe transport [Arcicella sp. BE140]MDR6822849.1 outer membrane receptor protein involved in Fe transport [Arcicella sp. BE139]
MLYFTKTQKHLFFLILLTLLPFLGIAQGIIKGQVKDAQTATPLSFSTIRIYNDADQKLVGGNIASDAGEFSIANPYGTYYALVEFIGYKAFKSPVFTISKDKKTIDLGLILLTSSSSTLDEVVVQAEKSTMELTLDKKIFNVGKDLSNAGGSASDILSNIPSISVDAEGGVKLRGSDNVRILIDGKPSGLVSFKGGAGLQQLQGSLIERVEIITNPSARYEAEGMSGIINIILKKEQKQGFNGSFELISGTPANYGVSANVNYRHRKVNFFINYGISYRDLRGNGKLFQNVFSNDTTFTLNQTNSGSVKGLNNNIKGGLDFFLTDKDIFTASYLFRRSDVRRITDFRYDDSNNRTEALHTITYRQQDETETEPNSEYSITYKKNFDKKGQELVADVRYLDYWERSDQTFTQNGFWVDGKPNPANTKLQKALNDEAEKQILLQVDYIQPISKEGKIETGLRTSFRNMTNDYNVTQQNASGAFVSLPGLTNNFVYDENISAAYGIIGNKGKLFSYQVGLRAELTNVTTTLKQTNEVNPRKYANLFPSTHFTVNLPNENALQISYSRRVRRPTYNDLSPFVTFSDQRNYFSGNPNLNPEFTNAFELGHVKYFEKGSLSSSVYYRQTDGKIESIRSVNSAGISTTLPLNLVGQNSFGAEFATTYSPEKWWKLDLSWSFFRAITDGSNVSATYKSDTYSWFARQTSKFNLPRGIDLQVRANYEAPQQLPQGRRGYLFYTDLAVNKDVLKGKGTLTLNILDVFNSRRIRTVIEGVNFYSNRDFLPRQRQINLTLSYRLNQAKSASKPKIEE